MKTSYFAKASEYPTAISIAGRAPEGFRGRQYKKLAPKVWFFKKYKEDGDEACYTEHYYAEVLNKFDAREIFEELGEDAILLCWEAPGKFCHRHLIAKWLMEELGVEIREL